MLNYPLKPYHLSYVIILAIDDDSSAEVKATKLLNTALLLVMRNQNQIMNMLDHKFHQIWYYI